MTHLINNIYGVEVPEEGTDGAELRGHSDGSPVTLSFYGCATSIDLPTGNWEIIGLAHEVTEEMSAGIVEILEFQHESKSEDLSFFVFKNYQFPDSFHKTAKESLSSLLHSKGLNGNVLILKKID